MILRFLAHPTKLGTWILHHRCLIGNMLHFCSRWMRLLEELTQTSKNSEHTCIYIWLGVCLVRFLSPIAFASLYVNSSGNLIALECKFVAFTPATSVNTKKWSYDCPREESLKKNLHKLANGVIMHAFHMVGYICSTFLSHMHFMWDFGQKGSWLEASKLWLRKRQQQKVSSPFLFPTSYEGDNQGEVMR